MNYRPGREYFNQKIAGSASSLAVSPCHDLIAVGSWKTDISLYSMQEGKAKSLGKLRGHSGTYFTL
jgi:WD40 repeat protein